MGQAVYSVLLLWENDFLKFRTFYLDIISNLPLIQIHWLLHFTTSFNIVFSPFEYMWGEKQHKAIFFLSKSFQSPQLIGASSQRPKSCGFGSQSGHMPRFQVWPPIGVCTGGNQLMLCSHINASLSLPPSLLLSLKLMSRSLSKD